MRPSWVPTASPMGLCHDRDLQTPAVAVRRRSIRVDGSTTLVVTTRNYTALSPESFPVFPTDARVAPSSPAGAR